jgi:hypothetical protein
VHKLPLLTSVLEFVNEGWHCGVFEFLIPGIPEVSIVKLPKLNRKEVALTDTD